MKPAVMIKTKLGLSFYNAVFHNFNEYKKRDDLSSFREIVFVHRKSIEAEIVDFLENPLTVKSHNMDESDIEGWIKYTELSDKYSALNHFYNRK